MSSDTPFQIRGGNDQNTALHNRITALERIKFLSGGVDLRNKSNTYLRAFDLEMWKRFYKDRPQSEWGVSEDFCQNAAAVIKDMESSDVTVNEEEFNAEYDEFTKRKAVDDAIKQPEINKEVPGETKPKQD